MKCSEKECDGEIFFTRSLEKTFRKRFKVLNYFCPKCGWIKMFKIGITKKEYKKEEDNESKIFRL